MKKSDPWTNISSLTPKASTSLSREVWRQTRSDDRIPQTVMRTDTRITLANDRGPYTSMLAHVLQGSITNLLAVKSKCAHHSRLRRWTVRATKRVEEFWRSGNTCPSSYVVFVCGESRYVRKNSPAEDPEIQVIARAIISAFASCKPLDYLHYHRNSSGVLRCWHIPRHRPPRFPVVQRTSTSLEWSRSWAAGTLFFR